MGDLQTVPQVVPHAEISPEICCDALIDKINQLPATMGTMSTTQLQDLQQQLNTIGTNAHNHIEKIEAVCHQEFQPPNQAPQLPVHR